MKYDAETIANACAFANKREATDHAAYMVACYWLKSADAIIKRGDKPVKLSKCGLTLAQGELDRDIYGRYRRNMDSTLVRSQAIQIAKAKLWSGQFPSVASHFSAHAVDSDSAKLAASLLRECGEAVAK